MPILGGIGNISEYSYRGFRTKCPDYLDFRSATNANPGQIIFSNYEKIGGIKNELTASISIGASFSIHGDVFDSNQTYTFDSTKVTFDSFSNPSTRFTSDDKLVKLDDYVILSYYLPNSVKEDFGKDYIITLTIGKCDYPWQVNTRPIENIPNDFNFTSVENRSISTVIESNQITVSGLEPGYTFPFNVFSETYIYYGPNETGSKTEEQFVDTLTVTYNSTTEFTIPANAYDVELLVSGGGSGDGGDALREPGFTSLNTPYRTSGGVGAPGQLIKLFVGNKLSGKTFKWWGATDAENAESTSLSGPVGRNITKGGAGGVSDYAISGTNYIKGGDGGDNTELRERLGKLSKSGAGGGGGAPGIITRRETSGSTSFNRLLVIAAGASGASGASPGDENPYNGTTPNSVVKFSSGSSLLSGEDATNSTTWGAKGGQGAGSRPGGAPRGWIWDDTSFPIERYEVDTVNGRLNAPRLTLIYKQLKTRIINTTSPVVLQPNTQNCKIVVNGSIEYPFGSTANIQNGDTIKLKLTTSPNYDTLCSIVFGNLNKTSTWSVSTGKLSLNPTFTPSDFTNESGLNLSETVTSDQVTVSGLSAGVVYPGTVTNATIEVNGDGNYRSSTFNVSNNDNIRLRLTSSSSYGTAITSNVKIVNGTIDWIATTRSAPPPPPPPPPPPACSEEYYIYTYGGGGGVGSCGVGYVRRGPWYKARINGLPIDFYYPIVWLLEGTMRTVQDIFIEQWGVPVDLGIIEIYVNLFEDIGEKEFRRYIRYLQPTYTLTTLCGKSYTSIGNNPPASVYCEFIGNDTNKIKERFGPFTT